MILMFPELFFPLNQTRLFEEEAGLNREIPSPPIGSLERSEIGEDINSELSQPSQIDGLNQIPIVNKEILSLLQKNDQQLRVMKEQILKTTSGLVDELRNIERPSVPDSLEYFDHEVGDSTTSRFFVKSDREEASPSTRQCEIPENRTSLENTSFDFTEPRDLRMMPRQESGSFLSKNLIKREQDDSSIWNPIEGSAENTLFTSSSAHPENTLELSVDIPYKAIDSTPLIKPYDLSVPNMDPISNESERAFYFSSSIAPCENPTKQKNRSEQIDLSSTSDDLVSTKPKYKTAFYARTRDLYDPSKSTLTEEQIALINKKMEEVEHVSNPRKKRKATKNVKESERRLRVKNRRIEVADEYFALKDKCKKLEAIVAQCMHCHAQLSQTLRDRPH